MNSQELLPSKHYEVSKGFVNSDPRGDKRKLLLVISGTSWEWWDTLIISAFRRLRNNITSKLLPQNKQQQFPGVNYYHHPFYRKEKQGTGRSGNCSMLHTSLTVVYSQPPSSTASPWAFLIGFS